MKLFCFVFYSFTNKFLLCYTQTERELYSQQQGLKQKLTHMEKLITVSLQLSDNFTIINVFSRTIVGFNSEIWQLQLKEILTLTTVLYEHVEYEKNEKIHTLKGSSSDHRVRSVVVVFCDSLIPAKYYFLCVRVCAYVLVVRNEICVCYVCLLICFVLWNTIFTTRIWLRHQWKTL